MKIVACMPVYGRHVILKHTITRLLTINKVDIVICAGNLPEDKELVESCGAEWVEAENSPLGAKWNKAFQAAQKHNPDACLYIGSDDWLSEDYLPTMLPHLKTYDLIGKTDFYLCHISAYKDVVLSVAYSDGYVGTDREGESVGGGRLLSRKLLDKIKFTPFKEDEDNSMDWWMLQKAQGVNAKIKTFTGGSGNILAFSSNLWKTKHAFDVDATSYLENGDADDFLTKHFPDAYSVAEPMRVVACMPVYGRRRLLSRTITRLYQKNKVYKVICAGSGEKDKMIAERYGAEWVEAANSPLGHKWNEAFAAAEKYNPDACLFIGSSDWLEDKWLDVMLPLMKEYDMVGTPDFTMVDIRRDVYRVAYWRGYPEGSNRENEPVGGGRMLSNKLLKGMKWRPFNADWDNSMDYSMRLHAESLDAKMLLLPKGTLIVLSLGSDRWQNKHNYDREMKTGQATEMSNEDGIAFLDRVFPEALTLFDDDKWITT